MVRYLAFFIYLINFILNRNVWGDHNFPKDFIFGVSTSSYQIEGGWNENSKSENIWDHITHFHPEQIVDHSTGDVACDSYHKIDEDIRIIRELGVQSYRFSLSWSRILPDGFENRINKDGIRYYNELIDSLIRYNITPLATIYHKDHPQSLQDIGGWNNPFMIDLYVNYARVVFEHFGDRVKHWITINEPHFVCTTFKLGTVALDGFGPYLCASTLLKAHAKAYHMYKNDFAYQKGQIGISLDIDWHQPKTNTIKDIQATIRAFEFAVGLYANPIFSKHGDFPTIVKERVAKISALQNFSTSRLPQFTQTEIQTIQGTADFLGVNYYTTDVLSELSSNNLFKISYDTDISVNTEYDPSWPASESIWLKYFPAGIYHTLLYVKNIYGNPTVYITENGFSDNSFQDYERINYFEGYLENISKAISEGCNVVGYYVWSLMDNFQWRSGYTEHFGLYHVNFSDPNRTRTPRASAFWYKNFIKQHKN